MRNLEYKSRVTAGADLGLRRHTQGFGPPLFTYFVLLLYFEVLVIRYIYPITRPSFHYLSLKLSQSTAKVHQC